MLMNDLRGDYDRAAFGQDPGGVAEYMPHVSLLYGDLAMTSREKLCQEAQDIMQDMAFDIDTMEVWCTAGVVTEWKLLAQVSLKRR